MEEVEKAFCLKRVETPRGEEEMAYFRKACLAIIGYVKVVERIVSF